MEFLQERINTQNLQLTYELPSTRLRINKKKKDEEITCNEVNQTWENWRGKGNSGQKNKRGLFFNAQYMMNQNN